MSDYVDKLEYLEETKTLIKGALKAKGVAVSDSDTFRSYADKIQNIQTGGGSGGFEEGYQAGKNDGLEEGYNTGYSEGEAYGKANAPSENLSVTLKANGSYSYPKPSDKYHADVSVVVAVPSDSTPTQEKSKTITKNGTEVISPDNGYALSKVTVTTQIPERLPVQTKTIDIDENGTEEVTADSGYALEKVIINTDIDTRLPEQEKSLEVTENKVYEVTPDSGYALSKVTVTGNVASSGGGGESGDDAGQLAKITTFTADEWNVSADTNTYFTALIKTIDWTELNKLKRRTFYKFFEYYRGSSLDIHNLDTSHATNMSNMFAYSDILTLDLSGLDTSNATNMTNMFSACGKLTSLDLSGLDTSNVTNMASMFSSCSSLQSLNLSGLDTSNVTSMANMFSNDSKLTSLDLSGLDTSNVTNMNSVFNYCMNLTSLDLSSFNTSNVTNISNMFATCMNLTSVTFGNNWMSNSSVKSFDISGAPLSKESILDLASKIADKSNLTTTNTVRLKSSQKSLFTEEELTALAGQFTAKNWTLAWG